jgi:hypothetical protein
VLAVIDETNEFGQEESYSLKMAYLSDDSKEKSSVNPNSAIFDSMTDYGGNPQRKSID